MSSGFVTESEIEAKKIARQAEWDKVRKPEDPLDAPEEPPPDTRSLYDRLQEQKMKKQDEFEEAHKLKNLVKGLDDDEADFLEHVDKRKMDIERQKRLEEAKELNEFRSKMAEMREQELNKHIQKELGLLKSSKPARPVIESPSIGSLKHQSKLLAGIVKRKSPAAAEDTNKRPRLEGKDDKVSPPVAKSSVVVTSKRVLPGLASYSDSSNSDDESSDSERGDSVPRDLCGRQLVESEEDPKKKK